MTVHRSHIISYVLLLILIILCYSNTINVPWHFDDQPNILENPAVHISNIDFQSIKNTFFADPKFNENIYRPIAIFSFAINWYFGKDSTFGYHITNLAIHIITSLLLFKVSIIILELPHFNNLSNEGKFFIALFGTTLWAIHPINTQAVTYIVQRMASMGAMFFLFSLLSYLYARLIIKTTSRRIAYLLLSLLFFLLALGSKENTITLIPTIFLIELFLYAGNNRSIVFFRLVFIANIFLLASACYFIHSQGYLHSITLPYGNRTFSIAERLLTQPSVLLFYLSLLIFPNPSRFSVDHNFQISTSIFNLWPTFASFFLIILIVLFCFLLRKRYPLASFSFLFFFINHAVESSIIPLEIIFEHRNYLPSMFLFILLASLVWKFLLFSSVHFRIAHYTTILLLPVLLIFVGLGTYSRNEVWASEEKLWSDALLKAPDSARSLAKLGIIYGWQKRKSEENFRRSLALLYKATDLDYPNANAKAAFYNNIGKLYASYNFQEEAIQYFKRALEINDQFIIARIDLANSLLETADLENALIEFNKILATKNVSKKFYSDKAIIQLHLGRVQEALESSRIFLLHSEMNRADGYYLLGVSFTKAGNPLKGRWFLKLAEPKLSNDIRFLSSILENSLLLDDLLEARKYSSEILSYYNLPAILKFLESRKYDYTTAPIDTKLIAPLIRNQAISFLDT